MKVLYFCSIKILKITVMKTNLKLFGSSLAICVAMIACDKSNFTPLTDQEEPIVESPDDSSAMTDSLAFGVTNYKTTYRFFNKFGK